MFGVARVDLPARVLLTLVAADETATYSKPILQALSVASQRGIAVKLMDTLDIPIFNKEGSPV